MLRRIIDLLKGQLRPKKKPTRVRDVFTAKKGEKPPRLMGFTREKAPSIGTPSIVTPPQAERSIPKPIEPPIPQKPEEEKPPEIKSEKRPPTLLKPSVEPTAEEVARQDEQPVPPTAEPKAPEPIEKEEKSVAEELAKLPKPQIPRELEEEKGPPAKDISKEAEREIVVTTPIPSKEKRFINIGLDFGTSGTKIICRDLIGRKAWVFNFDHGLIDFPTFVMPSSVRIFDGAIHFGAEAERISPRGVGVRSFKICLVCQLGFIGQDQCNLFCPFAKSSSEKKSLFIDGENPIQVDPFNLCTLYIAHAIRLVKNSLRKTFGEKFDLKITMNLGVPIDYLRKGSLEEEFGRALYLGNRISDIIEDGQNVQDLLKLLEELKKINTVIPGPEKRPTFIQPETIAAVLSYILSPVADIGLYGIADVGAGTTDVVFFRYSELNGERKLAIYHADSHLLGVNKIDYELFSFLEEAGIIPKGHSNSRKSEIVQKLRSIKKMMSINENVKIRVGKQDFSIHHSDYEEIAQAVGREIYPKYKATWQKAYAKEPKQSAADFTLFRIGGGSRIAGIADQFLEKPWPHINRMAVQDIQIPPDLSMKSENGGKLEKFYPLLAVAYGLSYPVADLPEFILETIPWIPKLPRREMPLWDHYWEQL
jgi:hypothetical protein